MADDERWTEVVANIPPDRVELAADVLWQHGPAAVEEVASGRAVTVRAGFAEPAAAAAAAALRAAPAVGHPTVIVRTIGAGEVEAGLDAWRAWARPVRAGAFTVVPAWLAPDDADTELGEGEVHRLRIDPGRAFGSGSHVSTRLVLARLPSLVRPGDRVLDVGCGSGVLSVAAAVLGARSVDGIDIDPAAPDALRTNAAANGVAEVVAWVDRTAADLAADEARAGGPRYQVVAANLLGPTIVELAPALAALVAPGGAVIVSGLLDGAWDDPVHAVRSAADHDRRPPLAVEHVDTEEGWAAVTLRAGA